MGNQQPGGGVNLNCCGGNRKGDGSYISSEKIDRPTLQPPMPESYRNLTSSQQRQWHTDDISFVDGKPLKQDKSLSAKTTSSIDIYTTQSDLVLLNKAREQKDIRTIVQLLQSDEPIALKDGVIHPWASNPRSVGALACSQLSIYASQKNPQFLPEFLKSIPTLVELLRSDSRDKQESAVIALDFLVDQDESVRKAMVRCGAVDALIQHLSAPKDLMKAAAAQILRNLYAGNHEIQMRLLTFGCVPYLVDLLNSSDSDIQYDGIQCNLDLVLDTSQRVIPEIADAMILKYHILKRLKALMTSPEEDIASEARRAFVILDEYNQQRQVSNIIFN